MIKQPIIMEKRVEIESWDYKGADTKEYTHGFHTYPAMMIPQIARRLIDTYGKNAKNLLDPFCGSGTSLVEASLTSNINKAYGFDLNPLAVLVARVKTTPLNQDPLKNIILATSLKNELAKIKTFKIPNFKNVDFWFKPEVIEDIAKLKVLINKTKDKDKNDFLAVCLSETIRRVSNTRNSEFKLYRMQAEKLKNYSPDVPTEFSKILLKNSESLDKYEKERKNTKIYAKVHNSMERLPLEDESIDLIVTSPPYGDSKTTVAYGQFSRLALQWMGYKEANTLDNRLLGGKAVRELEVKVDSPTLKNVIKEIAKIDEKRAREVLSFYNDFDKCVIELNRVMSKNGHVCFVVGNRTVKGINIPTDKIMCEMFQSHGNYEHITTYERAIPMKRMPKSNSPTNKQGKKVTTMNNEFIFILKKI